MRKQIAIIIFLGLALVVSVYFNLNLQKQNQNSCLDLYKYINPDLNCDEDPTSATVSLKKSVEEVVSTNISLKKADKVSIFYRDLVNRQWFGINENDSFSPASLLKLPLAIALYKVAQVDPSVLDKQLKIDKSNFENLYNIHNIKPEVELKENSTYSVEDLIEHMLKYSDNVALVTLSSSINKDFLNMVYKDLGVSLPLSYGKNQDFVSVKTYGSIMRVLFNASYLNQDLSNKLLQIMSQSKFKEGIVAGVPEKVGVSSKFGERTFFDVNNNKIDKVELHDCGIIYDERGAYSICVMTEGKDYESLTSVIANVSKVVYSNR